MNYTVSVIIPVYNAEKTIRRCVESLVYGKRRDIEVILVDDCSTDGSPELCKELETEFDNVRYIRNEKNSGVSFTRNHGIDSAEGKYLAFVDSDDWVSENYISELADLADNYPERLAVCGIRFVDRPNGIKRNYCGKKQEGVSLVDRKDYFGLVDDFLIQSPFNKLFKTEAVRNLQLYFDETMTMGEDFQFVLNYLERARCIGISVIHKPLYYYVRYHDNSLMGNYGFIQNDDELARIRQLYKITGLDQPEKCEEMLKKISANHIYHIVRNRTHTRKDKFEALGKIVGKENAQAEYVRQRLFQLKEKIWMASKNGSKTLRRIQDRFARDRQSNKLKAIRKKAGHLEDVTILSQNCIGGVFYHDMGLRFLSPTINLFFSAEDFVKFVLNLKHYTGVKLQWRWKEEYPVGILEDIEIHFMHYNDSREAEEAWNRRCQRIMFDRILVLSTDRDDFDDTVYELWKTVPYEKMLFTAKPSLSADSDSLFFPEYQTQGCVGDLIPGRQFYRDDVLLNKYKSV